VSLLYNYSANNETWNKWLMYGKNISSSPFRWNFTAKDGSGYYNFKVIVYYITGEIAESPVKSINLTLFPMIPLIVMIILLFMLIIVTLIVLGFRPFKFIKK